MIDGAQLSQLADDLRRIYADDPQAAGQTIESHLKKVLADCRPDERRAVVGKIIEYFKSPVDDSVPPADKAVLARVFSLVLGRKVTPDDVASGEVIERLADSLNTIFDALNRLISVINMSFSGGAHRGEQTIRQFIGFHLEGEDQTQSLEAYLGRINDAFLIAHEAFKTAAHNQVGHILEALDPEKLAAGRCGGLKIGTLRKAEDFDLMREKFDRIKRWFESGRFMKDYLREFEKNCQARHR